MTNPNCKLCRGRGRVPFCFPIVVPIALAPGVHDGPIDSVVQTYEIDCPECSKASGGIVVLEKDVATPKYMMGVSVPIQHLERGAAAALARHITEQPGFVRLTRREDPEKIVVTASIGVVSKDRLRALEERAETVAESFAREVLAEAEREIQNWGSHFGHSEILKRDATRLMYDALRTVMQRRKKDAA